MNKNYQVSDKSNEINRKQYLTNTHLSTWLPYKQTSTNCYVRISTEKHTSKKKKMCKWNLECAYTLKGVEAMYRCAKSCSAIVISMSCNGCKEELGLVSITKRSAGLQLQSKLFGGRGEFSILTAWCIKLIYHLGEPAWRVHDLLSDGRILKECVRGWWGRIQCQRVWGEGGFTNNDCCLPSDYRVMQEWFCQLRLIDQMKSSSSHRRFWRSRWLYFILYSVISFQSISCPQYARKVAASLLTNSRRREHVPAFHVSPYWLPVEFKIDFKATMLMLKAPSYILKMFMPQWREPRAGPVWCFLKLTEGSTCCRLLSTGIPCLTE